MLVKKSLIIFLICVSFIIGVGLATFIIGTGAAFHFNFGLPRLFLTAVILIVALIFLAPRSKLWLVALCFLFFISGFIRFRLSQPEINPEHVAFYNNSQLVLTGLVVSEPDIRTGQLKLTVGDLVGEQGKKLKGRILVSTALYPEYQYGDILKIDCHFKTPEKIDDFDYGRYLAKENIYSLCVLAKIKLISHSKGNWLYWGIIVFKNQATAVINWVLPEPQSSFLAGILWGAKRGLPQAVLDDFNKAGITHLLAVSGYNITVIGNCLSSLLLSFGFGRKKSFWLVIIFIGAFVILTGAPASVIRAAIMGILALVILNLGRKSKKHNLLALTVVLMLIVNPKILFWDVGFQLSFMATLGLVYLSGFLEKHLSWLTNKFGLRESLSTTLSATLATAPLIIFQFGRFSLISLPANLLVLPVIPLIMLLGFILLVISWVSIKAGLIFSWLVWPLLTYVLKAAAFFAARI